MTVFLAGLSDRGGIDQGQHLFDVIDDRPVKESLIPIEQGEKKDVTLQRRRFLSQVCHHPIDLLRLGLSMRRQQAAKPEPVSLRFGESRPLIQFRVVQDIQSVP